MVSLLLKECFSLFYVICTAFKNYSLLYTVGNYYAVLKELFECCKYLIQIRNH